MRRSGRGGVWLVAAPLAAGLAGCGGGGCDAAVRVPAGFCATRFASGLGPVRHLAVSERGAVYVADDSNGEIWRITGVRR